MPVSSAGVPELAAPAKIPLLVICGPTASGKTRIALELASGLPIEIISADSRQIYRGMDIGTAKATPEERALVPHHLIDVVAPDQSFSAADFMTQGRAAITAIHQRGKLAVVVGGTGLYIDALTRGLITAPGEDPELRLELLELETLQGEGTLHQRLQIVDPVAAQRLKPRDQLRIIRALEVFALTGETLTALQHRHAFADSPYHLVTIGLEVERSTLYRRIDERAATMFSSGLIEEAQSLLAQGFSRELKALRTIGYREAIAYLAGESSLAVAIEQTQQESRRYAKRQMTWFRKNNSIIKVDSLAEFAKIKTIAKRLYAE
ncbi:MAG: tRNA (adenosine(37)-N6)-dimethylallyltransferase MiaA [Desulfuromonadales bacterium]|nr:tRNA (adenosine(37)-N6)-dimethylallyltransferase MiaA [Desulfuromonadales bacterium]